ncbi:amino acid transporter, putative [Trypanosoma brucei brucei TREU927]|uniref:Amino acid transporter, putative n=1 Tax=Trypanosoma brucei brucei (strain 927/4 GUTat10.1) TaxID=185431 RepID=Q57V89_TRYB2|nr:amino acid transporter, putative [Trypanosoma brucei brucei TREU927]AAX70494.1 amino acid transporter, putative [Trypanosoma brucei]AAZ13531.1 amino acid transporter, putative [Trypanosoma brucei brucei TREU927]
MFKLLRIITPSLALWFLTPGQSTSFTLRGHLPQSHSLYLFSPISSRLSKGTKAGQTAPLMHPDGTTAPDSWRLTNPPDSVEAGATEGAATGSSIPHGSSEATGDKVGENNDRDQLTASGGERSQPFMECVKKVIPPGGLVSTVFNLAAMCIGAGILGLPAAANSSGLVMMFVYPTVIVFLSIYSLYCLATQIERHGLKSYEGMSRALLGPWSAYLTGVLRALNTFGACVAFIISVGDILSAILKGTNAPDFLKQKSGNRLLTSIIWLCFMLPLVIPRSVNTLRYMSAIGITSICYLVVVIVVHSYMNGLPDNIKKVHLTGAPGDEGIHLFGTGNKAVEGPGVFMFAFLCQANSFEVYLGMPKPNVHRFTAYTAIAMAVCFVLCIFAAFFGYLDFGGAVTGSVLLMYDPVNEPAIMVGFVGVLVKLCVSYALVAMACRNALYSFVGWDADDVAFWKHCVFVISLSAVILLCGLFIPTINTVFGFVGAVCGGFLAFILPSLFIMYGGGWSLKAVGWCHYLATYAVLFAGVALCVFGTGATVYSVAVEW